MPKNTNINLANKVARFKKWASSRQGTYGEWECDYQHWDELWKAAEESMKKSAGKGGLFRFFKKNGGSGSA